MHRFVVTFTLLVLPLALVACFREAPAPEAMPEPTKPPVIEAEPEVAPVPPEHLVTHNVTYTGIVEEGGVTIYQEGSHRLMLSDGKMVLLEPADGAEIVLDLYIGRLARAKGDVMPTVEAGGTIMQVREIEWIRREVNENGEVVEVMRMLCGEGSTCKEGYTCVLEEEVGVCMGEEDAEGAEELDDSEESSSLSSDSSEASSSESSASSEKSSSSESSSSESSESSSSESSATSASSEEAAEVTPSNDEIVQQMAEEDYAPGRWTQRYCSPHIEYCIPIHKNWYFYSFGATASTISHLEMGAQPVSNFGDGPIVVDLKSGDLAAIGVEDGIVKVIGNKVIGYRRWSDNRHFEVSAHASLRDPVSYITGELSAAE